jgi:sulfur relay protein TusB/DsrH
MTDRAKNGTCLHLVVRSSTEAMDRCRSQFTEGDTVVFLDDGVIHLCAAVRESFGHSLPDSCFSDVDLDARGLLQAARAAGAKVVCDSGFVDLLRKHDFCLTWK